MRAFAFVVAALLAVGAVAATHWTETQVLTTARPTDAGAGISVAQQRGWWLRACVVQPTDGGAAVFGGTGSFKVWDYDPQEGQWEWAKTFDVSQTTSGADGRCQSFGDVELAVPSPGRRVYATTNGITVDGGSTLPDGGYQIRLRITACPSGSTGC